MTQLAQLKPELHPLKKPPKADLSWHESLVTIYKVVLPMLMTMGITLKGLRDQELGVVDRKVITNKFGAEVEIVTISAT